jgi:hypothetical protein
MNDKVQYVNRKWKQVIMPFTFAAALALAYVLFSLAEWVYGNDEYLRDDLLKFCLLVIVFYVPFYGILRLIRAVVLSGMSKPHV